MGQSNNKPNIDAYLSALLVAAAVVVVGLVVIIFVFLGWEFFFDYAVDFFSFSSMALIDRLNVILVLVAIGVFVWLVLFGRKKNVGIRVPCLIAVVGAIVPSALWLYYSYYMTTPFGGIYVFAPLLFAFIYLIPMGAAIGVLLGTVVEYFRKSNDGIHHTAPYFALGFMGYGLGERLAGMWGATIGVVLGCVIAFWLTAPHRHKGETD